MTRHIWTDEEIKHLVKITPGHHYKEILDLMNEKFDCNFTFNQVSRKIQHLKLRNGIDTKFQNGREPFNKGKKIEEYTSKQGIENSKKTRFKKGHKPANKRPIGSERIDVYGHTEIKVAEPSKWRKKTYSPMGRGKRKNS